MPLKSFKQFCRETSETPAEPRKLRMTLHELVEALEATFDREHIVEVSLDVPEPDMIAVAFYDRPAWVEMDRTKNDTEG